ncbi:hypothetical protein PIB30_002600 [Stylosanthes scabra]|uniref:Uncharacterized protein n=1 Tax=Stylosanthes scabra TaxID=79078 RepID=A0ABU6Z3W8_9FABA|nr:hypothetical protein [Stylosanthes scabra]
MAPIDSHFDTDCTDGSAIGNIQQYRRAIKVLCTNDLAIEQPSIISGGVRAMWCHNDSRAMIKLFNETRHRPFKYRTASFSPSLLHNLFVSPLTLSLSAVPPPSSLLIFSILRDSFAIPSPPLCSW